MTTQNSMIAGDLRRRNVFRGREQAAGESLLQPGDATSYRQPRQYSEEERLQMGRYESVDAFEPHNSIYLDHLQFRYREPRWFIWIFALVVGVMAGAAGILYISSMHVLINMKYYLLDYGVRGFPDQTHAENMNMTTDIFSGQQLPMQGAQQRNVWLGYWIWAGFSVGCSAIAAGLLKLFPGARGVGSPEVLAYLNGVNNQLTTTKTIFVARIAISLFTIGSGVCSGYFGTLVQAGVMLSTFVVERSRWIQFPNVNVIRCFRNPKDRRTIAIIGAAAGVGSALSVTIGGLMYVIEQVGQKLPVRVVFYTFCSCLISSFTLQLYFSFMNNYGTRDRQGSLSGDILNDVVIIFDTKLLRGNIVSMNIFDLIPTAFIGAVCGGLSVLYIRISWVSVRLRQRVQDKTFADFKYLESVIITLIYVTLTYWIAVWWGPSVEATDSAKSGCSLAPDGFMAKRRSSMVGYYGMISSLCEPGPYSNSSYTAGQDPFSQQPDRLPVFHNFGSLAMGPADNALQFLFTDSTSSYLQPATLIVFFIIYFVFAAATAGIAMGGDVIMPAMVIGATVGRLCGELTKQAATSISAETKLWADPSVFAVIGAGSFVGGVTGLTFSLCIILMEMTGDNRHIICVMVAISIAKMIADRYCHPITISHLEAQCVPILDFASRVHKYDMFCARHVMHFPVLTFTSTMDAKSIVDALGTTHNGFPVVSSRDRSLKGMVLRNQLEILLWNLYWTRKADPCTYARITEIEDRRFSEKITGLPPLSKKLLRTQIDLLPYVDFSAYAIHEATSLSRTYHMFRILGLRHLVVVNRSNQVVGMITRKDLVSDRMMERIQQENEKRRTVLGVGSPSEGVDSASDINDALSVFLLNRKQQSESHHELGGVNADSASPLIASRKLPKLSELVIDEHEDQEYTIIDIRRDAPTTSSGGSRSGSVAVPITPAGDRYLNKNLLFDVDPQAVEGFYAQASKARFTSSEIQRNEPQVSSPLGLAPVGSYLPPSIPGGLGTGAYRPREGQLNNDDPIQPIYAQPPRQQNLQPTPAYPPKQPPHQKQQSSPTQQRVSQPIPTGQTQGENSSKQASQTTADVVTSPIEVKPDPESSPPLSKAIEPTPESSKPTEMKTSNVAASNEAPVVVVDKPTDDIRVNDTEAAVAVENAAGVPPPPPPSDTNGSPIEK